MDAFQATLDRLKVALALKTNKQLAEAIGITASNLGERKTRGSLPMRQIEALCHARGINLDWVLTSRGPMRIGAAQPVKEGDSVAGLVSASRGSYAPPLNSELLAAAIAAIDGGLEERGWQLDRAAKARTAAALYEMSLAAGRINLALVAPLLNVLGGGR